MTDVKGMMVMVFGDHPITRVLDFFIENKNNDYTKTEIAELAGISRPTVYKVLKKFKKRKMIRLSRKIGNAQLYALNQDNPVVKALLELGTKLARIYAQNLELFEPRKVLA